MIVPKFYTVRNIELITKRDRKTVVRHAVRLGFSNKTFFTEEQKKELCKSLMAKYLIMNMPTSEQTEINQQALEMVSRYKECYEMYVY